MYQEILQFISNHLNKRIYIKETMGHYADEHDLNELIEEISISYSVNLKSLKNVSDITVNDFIVYVVNKG